MTSDLDLARAAREGDAAALGLLLERHRAPLYAHALKLLGHGANAQDAVQETFLLAIRKIDQLRDPGKVEGWLHTVLRSVCLSQLRGQYEHGDPVELRAPAAETPEAAIEDLAIRDWVWTAIARLSEPLRLVTMLRHFSSCSSYDDIAKVCDIPVGTVRSRLAEARRLLAEDLLRVAEHAHHEAAAQTRAERSSIKAAFEGYNDGRQERFVERFDRDVEVWWPGSGTRLQGQEVLRAGLAQDAEDGVTVQLGNIIASNGFTIIEAGFVNPADDPFHCPPGVTQVHEVRNGLTQRMTMYYPPRPELRGAASR